MNQQQQFGNMNNFDQMMNQGQFMPQYGQPQFNQQPQQINQNYMQQQYQQQPQPQVINQQEEQQYEYENEDDYENQEDDALAMMNSAQKEQYELYQMMMLQQQQQQLQQQQQPQQQQVQETAPSTASTSTAGTEKKGLGKKKMRVGASSYNPNEVKAQEQQQQPQQVMQQQQLPYQQMDMNYMMMNQMQMPFMGMGPMGMPMGMPMMGMPGQMMGMPNFGISQDNFAMFQNMEKKKKRVGAQGGIVSFGGVDKAKKKKKKETEGDKPKKPKIFKVKTDVPRVLVKKQMVKEDELFKMEEGFDYTSGLLHKVDESRQPLNIVFIGHVDAGKSTICGNILVKSGKVDPIELKKFESEAISLGRDTWFLAYIMDISIEERAKGKTVEVGKATFNTPSKRFTLLDAPGHKNYVPNMLAGASQSDVACLVVSAKTGEFESGFEKDGQTREHAMLVRSLGCQYMIVVVNKMDECKWSQERFNYIKEQLEPFLEKQCGLNQKEISWCAISGMTGENIQEKNKENSLSDWYKGLTLFELLDSVPIPERNPDADLRIPVLDAMKDMGQFLFGKVESGIIVQGQQVTMMPYQKVFTVQHIFNADDQCVPYGKPGENLKLKVKDIDEDDIRRGFIICNNEDFCQFCYELEAELQILELPDHKQLMSAGYSCVIHLHTIMEEVEISHIIAKKVDGEAKPTSFLRSGLTGIVRIQSKSYLCVEKYSKDAHLGSFTLRDEGRTIALGKILRLKPAKKLPKIQETVAVEEPKTEVAQQQE